MMGNVEFIKGHGTGNDFVILPDPDGELALTPERVAALCDRRRGIGADGVLRVVRAAKHPEGLAVRSAAERSGVAGERTDSATGAIPTAEAEWFMDYWNADGSLAEMCGNGVRVFTRYLLDTGLAEPVAGGLPIVTRAGVVRVVPGPAEIGRAVVADGEIGVDLGVPRVTGTSTATTGHLTLPGTAVDVGNPHLVCPLPAGIALSTLDLLRAPEFDPETFPDGVNIEFVTPGDPVPGADLHVHMRVYERGSAETLSCGSGTVAVAAVALRGAGLDAGVVAVDVPGGRLTITLDGEHCWLAGPATLVAHGTLDAPLA